MPKRTSGIALFSAAFAVLAVGCGEPREQREAWEQAAAADTLEAYVAFRDRYPDSRRAEEVNGAIERVGNEAMKRAFTALSEYDAEYAAPVYREILDVVPDHTLANMHLAMLSLVEADGIEEPERRRAKVTKAIALFRRARENAAGQVLTGRPVRGLVYFPRRALELEFHPEVRPVAGDGDVGSTLDWYIEHFETELAENPVLQPGYDRSQ